MKTFHWESNKYSIIKTSLQFTWRKYLNLNELFISFIIEFNFSMRFHSSFLVESGELLYFWVTIRITNEKFVPIYPYQWRDCKYMELEKAYLRINVFVFVT